MADRDIRRVASDELARRRELAAAMPVEESTPASRGPEIGATGLEVFGGMISGELADHHRDWRDQQIYKTVDRMRRGDATVSATLLSITLPILSADVRVESKQGPEASEPDPIVKEAADFVHANLFGDYMTRSWQGWIREAMLYVAYGHYVFEKVFQEMVGGEYSGAVMWRKFAPRHPSTIQAWNFDRNGGINSIEQEAYFGEEMARVALPIEKIMVLTHQEEAGNPLGHSVFRPAFKHWKYKDGFYAVQAIAIERQGAGVPFAKYPPGTSDSEIDKAEIMLQNVQAHEQSYFTFQDDWDVGFMDMGAGSTLDPQQAIDHHDLMITKTMLASFMNLPQDSRGSYAMSNDLSGFFNHSLQYAANYLADIINRHAIPQLCVANYGVLPAYPKLQFEKIGHLSLRNLILSIGELAKEGVITSTVDLENVVRDKLNLPPITEQEYDEQQPEEPAVLPPPPPGGRPTDNE